MTANFTSGKTAGRRINAAKLLALLCQLMLIFTHIIACSAQDESELRRIVESTTDPRAQAKLTKQMGDQYISQDKYPEASQAYTQALNSDRSGFSIGDRVRMGVYIYWADRLIDAIREFRLVLKEEPNNLEARTHLARTLSWSGELSEAIQEADLVLKNAPDNRDALIIKADALRWRDKIDQATPIYQSLIAKSGDFDAQLGMSYSRLAVGDRTGAIDIAKPLKPTTFAQQREYNKLVDTIEKETNPRFDARYLYYRDSDKNQLNRYFLSHAFWWQNWSLETSYKHTDANNEPGQNPTTNPSRSNRAEDLLFKVYHNVTDNVGLGASLGFNQLGDGRTTTQPIGQFRADAKIWNGTIGIGVTREVSTDTAQLIHNRIRATSVGWSASQALTDRLSIKPAYAYKSISDGSAADDFQFNTEYALLFDPKILVGHRFRYLDYRGQKGSGQFDPDNYIANRAFLSLYMQRPKYYAYAEAFLGHQKFRRNGFPTADFVKGGAASLGLTPTRNWTFEIYGEGGNFAASSASGFTYFMVGPRVIYRF